MAVALDMASYVLDVFSRLKRTEMTLIELHNHLNTQNNRMTIDEVLRLIRAPNSINLFNLQTISKDLCLVQFVPKLILCEACLQKGCKNKGNCTKLHICRYASHFTKKPLEKPCQFAHKLSDFPKNLELLRQYDLNTVNEDLLLDLLRLHYNQSQLEYQNHRLLTTATPSPSRPPAQLKKSPISLENPLERQVDISIPSEREAADLDLEIVQLLLAAKGIIVKPLLDKQICNEFYRRFTFQFANKQSIDDLLANESILIYNQIPIKMKRTRRRRDTKLFALKFLTNQTIDQIRLNLYVETLIGKVISNIFDMTPDESQERIYLIRSEQSIDFDHLYKVYSAKNTLQGHGVIITEVYETETLEISFANGPSQRLMTLPRLRQIIGDQRWEKEVFACLSIRQQRNAEIELMNAEITAEWLSQAQKFKQDYSLLIQPVIDFIPSAETKPEEDDDEEIRDLLTNSVRSANDSMKEEKEENNSFRYIVKQDWRIVLTHPVFGDEYRKYIRDNLNISIQIFGSSIEVSNEYTRKELARFTNMFIQTFVFHEVISPDKAEVKMIKENYSRMAHKWLKDTNRTLVAARRNVMAELFPRQFSMTPQLSKPLSAPTPRQKPSPTPRSQEKPLTPTRTSLPLPSSPKPIETKTTEENLHMVTYPIENDVYIPFFSKSHPFPARLFTYLSTAFNVKVEIKNAPSTKISLELKGHHKDLAEARHALNSRFGSLKTRAYPSSTDVCQFSIPDFHHVAQWHFNRASIVTSCSFSSKNGGLLSVRYFSNDPHFGTDEDKLDDILHHQLCGRSFPVSSTTNQLEKKLQELLKRIEQRSDYRQNICWSYDSEKKPSSIDLGGTKAAVGQYFQDIQKISDEYAPIICQVRLQPHEVDYLLKICSDELIKCEREHADDGVELRGALRDREAIGFLAPKRLHEKIKLFLLELCRIDSISKEFLCVAQLFEKRKQEMNDLAEKHRCLINIRLPSSSQAVAIPTVSKTYSDSIRISNGDLALESVDVLVVCSTSGQLRTAMIQSAGSRVEQELVGHDLARKAVSTSAGQLKQAKRLLFIPWMPPSTSSASQDARALSQSINDFVQGAIEYTVQQKFKSIAFPAIGCGGFGIPSNVIASIMIDAVHTALTANPTMRLTVTFAVPQPHVYDAFQAVLKQSTSTHRRRSPSPTRSPKLDRISITLTTANTNVDIARKLLKAYEQMLNS